MGTAQLIRTSTWLAHGPIEGFCGYRPARRSVRVAPGVDGTPERQQEFES